MATRRYLEWEVHGFRGRGLRSVTILTKNGDGKIVRAAIHHRPLDGVRKFAAELGRRLHGRGDASQFLRHRSTSFDKDNSHVST